MDFLIDTKNKKIILKYLDNWSSIKEKLNLNVIKKKYSSVLSIPLFLEKSNIEAQIKNIQEVALKNTLVIYTINQNSTNAKHFHDNNQTYNYIVSIGIKEKITHEIGYIHTNSNVDFIVIDKYSNPLSPKQGVGTARKIGADIALLLLAENKLTTNCLYSSDGDTLFPCDYFNETLLKNYSMIHKQFTHYPYELNSPDEIRALHAYEYYLDYYPAWLKWAGSNYGFPTIGSCFVFSLLSYAKVRGFPEKQAGEDFYLANKLAKVGKVSISSNKPILIQGRKSTRAPFGTGPSIIEIARGFKIGKVFELPSEECFQILKNILMQVEQIMGNKRLKLTESKDVKDFLININFYDQIETCKKSSKNVRIRAKNFNDWFDGLRQLQLINHLSRCSFPKKPYNVTKMPNFDDLS